MAAKFENSEAVILVDLAMARTNRSRDDIADEIGINPNMLSMIRHGSTPLPVARVARFAEVLGIDEDTLLDAGVQSYAAGNRTWATVGMMRTPRKPVSLSAGVSPPMTVTVTKRPQKTSVASP